MQKTLKPSTNPLTIDFFCHVIDYFGDVAVGLRLAKALKKVSPNYKIRFFCDSQSTLATLTNFNASFDTEIEGVEIYGFNQAQTIPSKHVAIEILGCNLPSWCHAKNIVNLEYLTAELWSVDFHLQSSILGNNINKKFFMPGFHHGTAGLVKNYANIISKQEFCQKFKLKAKPYKPWLSLYLYQVDFTSLASLDNYEIIALGNYSSANIDNPNNTDYPANFYPIKLTMNDYDTLVNIADFNLVRGEDSLSRALLAQKPFFWQAYRQEEDYHFEKINAFLDFIEQFLTSDIFNLYKNELLEFNRTGKFSPLFFSDTYYVMLSHAMLNIFKHFEDIGYQEYHLLNLLEKEFNK